MKTSLFAGLLILAGVFAPTYAETNNFEVGGQIRHRYQADDRAFSDPRYLTFNQLRSRLNVKYKVSNDITGFVQFQDSRRFGEMASTIDGSANQIDLHQGFIQVNDFFFNWLDAKAGRMSVNYGNQRLVGALEWHNVARSFDGLIFTPWAGKHSIDLFYFVIRDSLRRSDQGNFNFFGFNANIYTSERYTNQVYLMWQRQNPSTDLNRWTIGFYSNGRLGNFYHFTEFAYQGGDITPDTTRNDVQAYFGTISLGWKDVGERGYKPDARIGVDFLSGDDNLGDDKYRVFDTLYATNHKFYGFMDYFLNIPRDTFGRGLIDAHIRATIAPAEKTKTQLAFHYFRSHRSVVLSDDSRSKAFGSELDLTLVYQYDAKLNITCGASVFFPGAIFKDFPSVFDKLGGRDRGGDRTTAWFYIMTTLTI
ncbi:MAG: alginate export family protein [Candidatus Latescibacterota bacterium]|nr:MAG: alginate export family protein [Candidatus Latescibacterota bacterium]